MKFLAMFLLLAASALAQVTPFGTLGTPQVVPDPFFPLGAPGAATLNGSYCASGSTAGLNFAVAGLPLGYNTGPAATQESIIFAFDVGVAALPGITVLQGNILLPLTGSLLLMGGGPAAWLGPGDTVPCPGLIPFPGTTPPTGNGLRINILLPPGIVGTFSVQGFVFDPALGRLFSTNAHNFSIP